MEQQSRFGILMENLGLTPAKRKIIIILMIAMIGFVVVMVVVNRVIEERSQNIIIENYNEYLSGAPNNYKKTLLSEVYRAIKDSLPLDVDEDTFVSDARIRDDSYEEIVEDDIVSASFLLDIDSLKMTYDVAFSWSKDKKETLPDSVIVNCPPIYDMKYPETTCYGMYNETSSPELYLPYTTYKDDGTAKYQITITPELYFINIYTNACGNTDLIEQYKKEALTWLQSTPIHYKNYSLYYDDVCNKEVY